LLELLKFQKEKNEKINIGKQYEANLSLFMDNFQLLCKHISKLLLKKPWLMDFGIVENTFKAVVKESQEIVKNRLSTQEETEREYINSENN